MNEVWKIRQSVPVEFWNLVLGKDTLADLVTRANTSLAKLTWGKWFYGPPFV